MIVYRQRKGERAADGTDEERASIEDRRGAGRAQDQSRDEDEAHEQRAVNRALDEAGSPVLPDRLEARRAVAEPIEGDAGQEINDRPQARLGDRGAEAREENRQERLTNKLRRVGDERGQGGDDAAQGKKPVRSRPSAAAG